MSIVNKPYYPIDNSWASSLSFSTQKEILLAPCKANGETRTNITILTEPFEATILTEWGTVVEKKLILVKDDAGFVYSVLWDARYLNEYDKPIKRQNFYLPMQ